ncbi:DNA polymerase-3 subunit alpha [Anoxybacillus voinovskiensis]|uniref:DNA polymerase III subunit alpha n=1 Tax=Anoxybacteroides voinovskiense TaxID=230470 RepID=A0A840E0L2_9BACL|nr:DNA polymerase III subunit alpha [Anoxybacillus voinovskiensis]MBB4074756.1 DNA polymerase-3 subunit alpha [Anoxybacillus voinovskiensis]GGJ72543.1 DNA polymerase III subunit alpha [Anoxybacillus voinovskiensis]
MAFVHLHVRSGYSLLNGTAKINDLVKKASDLRFHALALTDENVLYGAIPFYKECQKYGIKPIIGMVALVKLEEKGYPLVLLAKNDIGYRHLLKISSAIQTKAQDGIPEKWLRHYREGLIALTPGNDGQIETLLAQNGWEKAREVADTYKRLFTSDFYIAIQRHGKEETWQRELIRLSKEANIPLVATNNVHYLEKEDAFVHECLLAIQRGTKIHEEGKRLESGEYYLKSAEEMASLFADIPEAIANTEKIAAQCHIDIRVGERKLPKYPVPNNENAHDYLRKLCFEGLQERLASPSPVYVERLEYELEMIKKMNFSDYFLIVWDFMNFARKQGIMTGPGRGSAAGSLVAYTLYITNVDPIPYGLLFERFLNPARVSMPDIDIDFPDDRRDEVIQYVAKKYGTQHVAQIITFGTFGARAALRDVARAMGVTAKEVEQLLKYLPHKLGVTLQEAYDDVPAFRKEVHASERMHQLFMTALRLEGLPRHTSTHAAGVVISEQPLSDIVPLQQGHGDIYLTQYAMDVLEQLGLLKMDFLGLRTLTLIGNIQKLVQQKTKQSVDLTNIPLDDKKTYELLSNGDTSGIFQLESEGIKQVLRQLKPSQFEDIVAVNALYRPGPMEFIPVYIRRKHGEEAVTYLHEDLKPILQSTYGVLIYQEQIMHIAAKMAGFSLGEADLLRRAVGKKKKEILDEKRTHFVNGCIERGYSETIAHELYDAIVRFANYGFNRSHAVAYSLLAYQLAYLKAHYPFYFYAALLTSAIGDEKKLAEYMQEMRKRRIPLLPPSINRSYYSFAIEDGHIRFSLAGIKHVGAIAVKAIVDERKKRPFSDLFDFCVRLSKKTVNRKTIESLILAGCFDEFGVERSVLLATLDAALEHADLMGPYIGEDIFASEFSFKPKYVEAPPLSLEEKLAHEKELLGVYVSPHPISAKIERLQAAGATSIADALKERSDQYVRVGAYVVSERKTRTKNGEEMAFFTISDESEEIEAVAFPAAYRHYQSLLKRGEIVLLEGKVETRGGNGKIIIKNVTALSEETLFIKICPHHIPKLASLKQLLQRYRGTVPVVLYYEHERKTVKLSPDYYVNASSKCVMELKTLIGGPYVVVK